MLDAAAPDQAPGWSPLGNQPAWRKKLILHTAVLWALVIAHAGFMAWAQRPDPDRTSFWGAYGFDILTTATDCDLLKQQQQGWSLVVNILATLITYVSSDVLLALSAPSRRQLDAAHGQRRYMEVGVHSFHNIISPGFGWKRRILWFALTALILPFHLIYNSVIIVSQPASESYQVMIPDSMIAFSSQAAIASSTAAGGSSPTLTPSAAVSCTATVTSVSVQTTLPSATTQPHMDTDCDAWAVAPCGIGCEAFASQARTPFLDFRKWNPDVDVDGSDNCQQFYGGYAYCVGASSSSKIRRRRSAIPVGRSTNTNSLVNESQVVDNAIQGPGWSTFQGNTNWRTSYATSPFLAWMGNASINSTNPAEWPGLSVVTSDVNDFLSIAYTTNQDRSIAQDITIPSSDWTKLSLDVCRESFSDHYRASTGTVVLLVSGLDTTDAVVGLSYISYNWTDLIVSCPTQFLDSVPGGSAVIQAENPPVLPLTFGTFGRESPPLARTKAGFSGEYSVCPSSYPNTPQYQPQSQPQVEACFLKTRASQCRIGVNVLFMVILFVALIIKVLAMTFALFVIVDKPILTVGDAMADYLEHPDKHTESCSFSWTKRHGWQIVDGPISTHPFIPQSGETRDESTEAKIKNGVGLWSRTWLGRQMRKVWGYSDMGLKEPVPTSDIFNNLKTMRSTDSVVWLWAYLCTLGVCFGIFYSINAQDGWIVLPAASADLFWMLWPTILCNLPQLFATFRGFVDTLILTSRSSIEDFASYATDRKGLRVSDPQKGTAQYPAYFFGGMNAIVFLTTTSLQTWYAWIISQYAQPQWVNPLRPDDPPDYFSPAFLMRIGAQSSRSTAGKVCFCLLIALFPFLAVHLVNMTQSLVVRVRALRISQLSTFIPQYIADVLLLRWVTGFGRPEHTARYLPQVPLQMPGPATNSLVIALACQPKDRERKPGLSGKKVRWGVVRRPNPLAAPYLTESNNDPQQYQPSEKQAQSSSNPLGINAYPMNNTQASSQKPAAINVYPVKAHLPTVNRVASNEGAGLSPVCTSRRGVPPVYIYRAEANTAPEMSEISPASYSAYSPMSGDEAAFAASYFDEVIIDEEKGPGDDVIEHVRSETPPSESETSALVHGHCSFSAELTYALEPGQYYTGIRQGEGNLNLFQQVAQLVLRFFGNNRGSQEGSPHAEAH